MMRWLAFVGLLAISTVVWGTAFGILSVYPPMDLYVARTATIMLSAVVAWRALSGGWEP